MVALVRIATVLLLEDMTKLLLNLMWRLCQVKTTVRLKVPQLGSVVSLGTWLLKTSLKSTQDTYMEWWTFQMVQT